MKKLFLGVMLIFLVSLVASAQQKTKQKADEHKVKTATSKTKSKRTSSIPQKVHNVIHPRRKHYNGRKVKHKKT